MKTLSRFVAKFTKRIVEVYQPDRRRALLL